MRLKNFNEDIFTVTAILVGLLMIPSFWSAVAMDEGRTLHGIQLFVAKLFSILRFPTFPLLIFIFSVNPLSSLNILLLLLGLLINCMFYGLVVERIYFLFRYKNIL